MIAYMCKVDWEEDFPNSSDPGHVFASLEPLRRKRKCTEECGIVEVEVTLRKVIQESDFQFPNREDSAQDGESAG